MEEGTSPTFSGSVPCFRRFYCNFLSMDLIVYWHRSAGCQNQLDNAHLGKPIWPELQRWPGEELAFSARIFLASASQVHTGHLREYKKIDQEIYYLGAGGKEETCQTLKTSFIHSLKCL